MIGDAHASSFRYTRRRRTRARAARPVAAFAGIWRGGEYFFLTGKPDEFVFPFHEKAMPVILRPSDYEGWLSGAYEAARSLAQPFIEEMTVETEWPGATGADWHPWGPWRPLGAFPFLHEI